jgi:anaerobic selenocysteine-containing dehydrogenase
MVCLPEEIETPGVGQVRALVTVAGNPVVSAPDSDRLDRALAGLDFMVSVDIYVNETTRHADVILPPPPLIARGHYDLALYSFAVRNVANYSPPLVPLQDDERDESEILLQLSAIAAGSGADADPHALDDAIVTGMVEKAVRRPGSLVTDRDPAELLEMLRARRGPERILDLMLRTGPYGDGFGAHPDGLSLAELERHPHGVDFGPLEPRIPEVLRTASGSIELAPASLVEDLDRLRGALVERRAESLVLIGRRDLRSNNSWMHNVEVLVKGRERCTLLVHADDAGRLGLQDGAQVKVVGPGGSVLAPVEVSDEVMPGVVSLPHGWGHTRPGVQMRVAADHAGVNSNVLADTSHFDPLSGTAVLNGIPVELTPA